MKHIFAYLTSLLIVIGGLSAQMNGQAVNPPNTFWSTVFANSPSVSLNFNDSTTNFADKVSGSAFTQTATLNVGSLSPAPTSALSPGYAVVQSAVLPAMTVTGFCLTFFTAPTAGPYTFLYTSGTLPTLTITSSFTENVTSTTSSQCFTTSLAVPAGTHFGYWTPTTGTAVGLNSSATANPFAYTAGSSSLPSGAQTYTNSASASFDLTVSGTVNSPGTPTVHQTGFDSTNASNFSAGFPYNSYSAAPNNTMASNMEWYNPWTLLIHVDNLNYDRVGTLILASKGDVGSTTNSYWELYLTMNGGNSVACFVRNGNGNPPTTGGSGVRTQSICSPIGMDIMPNGYNYDIAVENTPSGFVTGLYVNGISVGVGGGSPFGIMEINPSGGTGYASSTPFIGVAGTGGPNCSLAGQMLSSSGVPNTSNGFNFTSNSGCLPTVFTATGSGTNLTVSSMVVPGYLAVGDNLVGTGIPAGTTIVSQTSGTTGGNGVYVTSASTTASAASVTAYPSITFTYSVPSTISIGNTCAAVLTTTSVTCTLSVNAGSTILQTTLPANTTSVTDSAGTMTLISGTPTGNGPVYYEANASAGSHVITITVAATEPTFYFPFSLEVRGASTTSPIDTVSYNHSATASTAVSVGPITTTGANEALIVGMSTIQNGGSGWLTPSSGFTLCTTPGNDTNCAISQVPTAGTYTFTVTQTTNNPWTAQMIAINPGVTNFSPSGTGVTINYAFGGQLMNSSTSPMFVPGYISNGIAYGIDGTDSSQNTTYIDEFAVFPTALTYTAINQLFYHTKFFQLVANTVSPKPVVIVDDDTFDDSDNEYLLQMAIGAHKAGLITLGGVVVEDYTPAAIAAWRQMLDSAGLNNVPVTIPPANPGTNSDYATTNVTAYNANTPISLGAWGYSTAMYRQIFANYPSTPIDVLLGNSVWCAPATFMQSAADGISSLTGLQMVQQNGLNGGAFYGQGFLFDYTSCGGEVVTNNQSMPIIWIGGSPMSGGPGPLYTRTSKDPLWLWFNSLGNDVRQCYDCLVLEAAISSKFTFGVGVTAPSGGTGYANSTPFTMAGGGPLCSAPGIMTASSGVPNGIIFPFGSTTAIGSFSGLGFGCPGSGFTATGSGTNLTVSAMTWGKIYVGATIAGTGVPTGTTIVSQTSGTTGGVGVYVTSAATTASAAAITGNPTIVLTAPTGTGVSLITAPTPCVSWTTSGGIPTGSYVTTTCSNQFITSGSYNTNNSPVSGEIMSWFINSLVDPVPTGMPR